MNLNIGNQCSIARNSLSRTVIHRVSFTMSFIKLSLLRADSSSRSLYSVIYLCPHLILAFCAPASVRDDSRLSHTARCPLESVLTALSFSNQSAVRNSAAHLYSGLMHQNRPFSISRHAAPWVAVLFLHLAISSVSRGTMVFRTKSRP